MLELHKQRPKSCVVVVKRGVQSHLVSWIRRGVMGVRAVRHVHAHCSRDRYPLSGRVPRDPLKKTLAMVVVLYACCTRDPYSLYEPHTAKPYYSVGVFLRNCFFLLQTIHIYVENTWAKFETISSMIRHTNKAKEKSRYVQEKQRILS